MARYAVPSRINFLMMRQCLFIIFLIPVFFAACSTNNVTVDNSLQRYFDTAGVRGDFGLFDNGQGHFTIYNLSRFRDSAYSPGGTFAILESVIAIQTGAVKDSNSIVSAQGETFSEAFRAPANDSFFLQLAARLGKDTLRKWIDSLRYGNKDLGHYPAAFWLDNSLAITSDEQLGLIKKLYFDQLPFFQRSQQIVRRMFPAERNSNYQLVYKTGQVTDGRGHAIGWVLGWVEENKHPYFFSLNLESADPTARLDSVGIQLVKKILAPMGFFEGKK